MRHVFVGGQIREGILKNLLAQGSLEETLLFVTVSRCAWATEIDGVK